MDRRLCLGAPRGFGSFPRRKSGTILCVLWLHFHMYRVIDVESLVYILGRPGQPASQPLNSPRGPSSISNAPCRSIFHLQRSLPAAFSTMLTTLLRISLNFEKASKKDVLWPQRLLRIGDCGIYEMVWCSQLPDRSGCLLTPNLMHAFT